MSVCFISKFLVNNRKVATSLGFFLSLLLVYYLLLSGKTNPSNLDHSLCALTIKDSHGTYILSFVLQRDPHSFFVCRQRYCRTK